MAGLSIAEIAGAVSLSSHKAIYDIRMKSSQTGSQVLDVRGKMLFVFKKSCEGWISDHKFALDYDYTGSPPMQVETKFTSFEKFDGTALNFSSNRYANGEQEQELRGHARVTKNGGVKNAAVFSIPDDIVFQLTEATLFPAAHTVKLIESAQAGRKIVHASVFDGSDDKGPVEINAVIGKKMPLLPDALALENVKGNTSLLKADKWPVRLAVFPENTKEQQTLSDYEMTMTLLDNGVISDMVVDYHNFSVSQKLVAIESVTEEQCGVEQND